MSHLELYKKYTPNRWAELIGQEKVAKSLKSAIVKDSLPTAYGFFGPRGCGKTSAAKLMARALNCENPPSKGESCGECDVCESIDNGSQMGVKYISMANKGSVADIRELAQVARQSFPVNKSVFILDEIHTISRPAWDALLIPIESKSMPTLFIFCSTEVHKIPDTIMSRIQSRRFSLVNDERMSKFLKQIAEKEGIDIDESTLDSVVREGRGSVRSALSTLEGVYSTGESKNSYGDQILEAIQSKNFTEFLKITAEAESDHVEMRLLAEQLFKDLRDILLKASGADEDLVPHCPVSDPRSFGVSMGGKKGLITLMNTIGEYLTKMSFGNDHRIMFEMSVLEGLGKVQKIARAKRSE